MRKIITLIIGLLFLPACNTDSATSVNQTNIEDVDISHYFQAPYSMNEYISPNDDGSNTVIISFSDYANESHIPSNRILEETTYTYGNANTTVSHYEVDEQRIVLNGNVQLTKELQWENDENHYVLIDTNATVLVKAGSFENCIIVEERSKKMDYSTLYYYAPEAGIIKIESVSPKNGRNLIAELVTVTYVNSDSEVSGQNNDEKKTGDNQRESFGKLPSKTDKVSKLSANEFVVSASEASMEAMDLYIMNRLSSWEERGDDYIWNYEYGIALLVDEHANVKEVAVTSEGPVTDEVIRIILSILQGLSPSISDSEIESILFSGNDKIYEIGEFRVGFVTDDKSYTFLAVVK